MSIAIFILGILLMYFSDTFIALVDKPHAMVLFAIGGTLVFFSAVVWFITPFISTPDSKPSTSRQTSKEVSEYHTEQGKKWNQEHKKMREWYSTMETRDRANTEKEANSRKEKEKELKYLRPYTKRGWWRRF